MMPICHLLYKIREDFSSTRYMDKNETIGLIPVFIPDLFCTFPILTMKCKIDYILIDKKASAAILVTIEDEIK